MASLKTIRLMFLFLFLIGVHRAYSQGDTTYKTWRFSRVPDAVTSHDVNSVRESARRFSYTYNTPQKLSA